MQGSLQPYFDACFTAISAVFNWFTSIFDGQWLLLVLSFPIVIMVVRLIINPLFGSSSSDSVVDYNNERDDFNDNR